MFICFTNTSLKKGHTSIRNFSKECLANYASIVFLWVGDQKINECLENTILKISFYSDRVEVRFYSLFLPPSLCLYLSFYIYAYMILFPFKQIRIFCKVINGWQLINLKFYFKPLYAEWQPKVWWRWISTWCQCLFAEAIHEQILSDYKRKFFKPSSYIHDIFFIVYEASLSFMVI